MMKRFVSILLLVVLSGFGRVSAASSLMQLFGEQHSKSQHSALFQANHLNHHAILSSAADSDNPEGIPDTEMDEEISDSESEYDGNQLAELPFYHHFVAFDVCFCKALLSKYETPIGSSKTALFIAFHNLRI